MLYNCIAFHYLVDVWMAIKHGTAERRDYQAMPHLDRYAGSELASQSESIDASAENAARRAAERSMRDRDRREGRATGVGVRRPGALQESGARLSPAAHLFNWREL